MQYLTLTDDNFTRADTPLILTTPNSTNVTGPGTFNAPGTNGNYIDKQGGVWAIQSDVLTTPAAGFILTKSFPGMSLLRPTAEDVLHGQVVVTGTSGITGSALGAVCRYNTTDSSAYAAYFYSNGGSDVKFAICVFKSAIAFTNLVTNASLPASLGSQPTVITLGYSGTSPTNLIATIATAAAPGTILATLTVADTYPTLQAVGQAGVAANGATLSNGTTSYVQATRLVTSQLGAAQNIVITPAVATSVANNSTQIFSVSLDGALAAGLTVTVNLVSTIGTLSQSSVVLTGTGGYNNPVPVTFTPGPLGSGALSGTHTVAGGSLALTDFTTIPITVILPPLTIGTLSAVQSSANISITTSAPLAGGSSAGYSYAVYRGTDPNFTANGSSLLATVTTLPYVDTTAVFGTEYYYGVVGTDSLAHTVNAIPTGLASASTTTLFYVGASLLSQDLCLVAVGDSITYGATSSNPGTIIAPTAVFYAIQSLQRTYGFRNVLASNQGVSGKTTFDWRPASSLYTAAKTAMTTLVATAAVGAMQVFSVMLGTNDSASQGTDNGNSASGTVIIGALTPAQYVANTQTLINQLLTDFPSAKIVVHLAPYYSPNTHNGATYEQAGLSTLWSYRAPLIAAIAAYKLTAPGHVFLGDTTAWDYFKVNYATELTGEGGTDGTFHLHPSSTASANGYVGTESIGTMWGQAIASALLAPPVSQAGPTVYHCHL